MSHFVKRASLYKGRASAAMGFGYVVTTFAAVPAGSTTHRGAWLPLWFPWLLATASLALLLRRPVCLRRRHALGLCLECGYDLRATTARCPECGAEVQHAQAGVIA